MQNTFLFQDIEFRVKNIDIQSITRPKGYQHYFGRGRDKSGFIYLRSGRVRYVISGEPATGITLEAGELIFLPIGTVYRHRVLETAEFCIVQFVGSKEDAPIYLSEPRKLNLPSAQELIEAFFTPYRNHATNHIFYYLSCLYRLLWMMDEQHNKLPAKYQRLRHAMRYLSENYCQDDPVGYYAELCQVSEPTFRRLFIEYTGLTPIEYRNRLRLTLARTLLQSGEHTVAETAELTGFSNRSYFTRLYKKHFGHLPKNS